MWKVALVATAVLINVFALRGVWRVPVAYPGQFLQGFFEDRQSVVGLTLDEQQQDRFLPNLSLTHDRLIDLPPGTNVAVVLEPSGTYEISGGELGIAPYCVFGNATALPRAASTSGDGADAGAPYRLVDTLTLDVERAGMVLRSWDASLPYREDERRLRALQETCVGDAAPARMLVERAGQRVTIRFGECTLETTLPLQSGDRPYVVAVVAGLQWHSVASQPDGFRVRRVFNRRAFGYATAAALIVVVLLTVTPGAWMPLAASVTLAVASLLLSPILCAALFVSVGLAGLAVAPLFLVVKLVRRERRVLRLTLVGSVYGGVALLVAWALTGSVERDAPPVEAHRIATIGEQPQCLLIGYSTADDVQVRSESPGTWRYLAEACGSCAGGVRKYALTSETFPRMHAFLCAPDSSLRTGEPVVFLGAGNDDFSAWSEGATSPWSVVARNPYIVTSFYYLLRNPSSSRLRSGIDHRASLSLENLEGQQRLISDAARCAIERGARFVYAHDFLVLDMDGSRSPSRREMLRGRDAAVTRAGGSFVDLLAELDDEVGVSWFNDMIHLSSVGHRHVAERICRELAKDPH